MNDLDEIREIITDETGRVPLGKPQAIGGGCINEAFRWDGYFIKTNSRECSDMFEAEKLGLLTLFRTMTVRVPQTVCSGTTSDRSFLILELLPLGSPDESSQANLGRQLAALHRSTGPDFGWIRDNYLGTTNQPNTATESWIDFLREYRLGYMLRLAANYGFSFRGADTLLNNLDSFFEEMPLPSLLHGDLWGGNASVLADGTPTIFDPAVYFGDRECDLAMTRLFGGFDAAFYRAYEEKWPLSPGNERRTDLYNLYHILNHSILFGGSYARQAQTMIDTLLLSL